MSADQLYTIAQDLLEAVVDVYATAGVSLPDRQVVVEGLPAWDCESVMVSLRRVFRGLPNIQSAQQTLLCAGVRTAEYHISIIRCASTPDDDGNPPTPTTIQGFSKPILTDAWVLVSGLQTAALDGDLGIACDSILIGDLAVVGPEGAFGGVDLVIQWQLGAG